MPTLHSDSTLVLATDSTYFSGAERSFANLASGLAASYSTTLLCTPEVEESFSKESGSAQVKGIVTRSKVNIAFFIRAISLLQRLAPQVLVINMWSPYANTLLLLAAKYTRTPTLTIYHYYQEKKDVTGLLRPIKLWAYRFGAKLATKIATVSEAHRQILITEFGFSESLVSVIPNGIAPVTIAEYAPHQPPRFLTVGTLELAKGYHIILDALHLVTTPISLSLVGDGPDRAYLESRAATVPTRHQVTFLGKQQNMGEQYRSHDILLQPSRIENLSMAILESMAYQLPCIASSVGGNPELVIHEETGLLVPFGDIAGWAAAIERGATENWQQLAISAHERWQHYFTLEHQIEATVQLLETL
jgi:glycosyltransferase involved in cell wall biosynthesis